MSAPLELRLGGFDERIASRLRQWKEERVVQRLWRRDGSLWPGGSEEDPTDRLGWLDLPSVGESTLGDWIGFADAEIELGVDHGVVLGMGGSSLAPEVFERTFGGQRRLLTILDGVHPDEIAALERRLDLERTLFIVSSKSGSTIETRSLFDYFWHRAKTSLADPGRQFVVVTDPGSALERLAGERELQRVFRAPEDVGGRYSALSAFGAVPGAFTGMDLRALMASARSAAEALRAGGRGARELSRLGAALGELALAGRDKLTLWTSPALAALPSWLEQLVAESTGKNGSGILPVVGEERLPAAEYSDDRFFVALQLDGDDDPQIGEHLRDLAAAGHPVAVIRLQERLDLGAELFRWQVAVALAGVVLEINPFSQPDVELAKRLARRAMEGGDAMRGALDALAQETVRQSAGSRLQEWIQTAMTAPYVSLQAYLPRRASTERRLLQLQGAVRDRTGRATSSGFGPRFLHSTGQLHKGGVAGARFLQLMLPWEEDLPIPQSRLTFGGLLRAQADGDAAALLERGQTVLRLELDREEDLDTLIDMVEDMR